MFRLLFIAVVLLIWVNPISNIPLNTNSTEFPKPVVTIEVLNNPPKVAMALRNDVELIPEIVDASRWDSHQIVCVALAVYHETRGLSDKSQFAVAAVVMNRSRDLVFPESPCEVVWQKYAFSWTAKTYKKKLPLEVDAWEKAQRIAYNVYFDPDTFDPTMGSTHFHAVKTRPRWAKFGQNKTRIETHVFMQVKG